MSIETEIVKELTNKVLADLDVSSLKSKVVPLLQKDLPKRIADSTAESDVVYDIVQDVLYDETFKKELKKLVLAALASAFNKD